jgi:fatty-acyl-CoA synthase
MERGLNLAKILWQTYRKSPDQVSIKLLFSGQEEQAVSYADLLRNSAGYALALARAGIRPGEVVILILEHGQDLISAFWGAILLGAIPSIMPFLTEKLLPDHYRQALEALFEITTPAAVVTYADFLSEVNTATRPVQSIRAIILSHEVSPPETLDPDQFTGISRSPEDIVLLQHSSGTTGLQKGVALSHQAILNQLESYNEALHLAPNDVIVSWLPLYHDMGLIAGFILPVISGIRLVLMSPFDWVRAPYRLLQAISDHRGSISWLPNFAYNFCAQKIRPRHLDGIDLSSLRAVINCSEPMNWKSHQLFLEAFQPYGLRPSALATCYAMAENVFAVTQGGIDSPVTIDCIEKRAFINQQVAKPVPPEQENDPVSTLKLLSAGQPIRHTHLRIVDSAGNPLADRNIGEIALQSNCMLTGYYHRPDLTEKAFQDDWYLTGDLGYLANGELFVTGRKKDLIIVGGKNIYPQDLERLASEIDGVHPGRVVAFGIPNETTGTEDVVLIAELDEYGALTEEEQEQMITKIRQNVTRGSDIALRYVHLVGRNWLLKTSSGKIARTANREKYLQEIN